MFRLRHYLVTPEWASYRFSGKKHKTDRYPSLEGHRPKFLGSRRGIRDTPLDRQFVSLSLHDWMGVYPNSTRRCSSRRSSAQETCRTSKLIIEFNREQTSAPLDLWGDRNRNSWLPLR